MGSSGSGRISDYPGTGGSGDSNTGAQDRCAKAFSARLEDVEQSEYYQTHRTLPPTGTSLQVSQRKRLVAQTAEGQSIGNLPTTFNYLAACMKDGWGYIGTVQSVTSGAPAPIVAVDFAATHSE